MTAHTYHDASLEVGLVDGCPRCEEHAADPLGGGLDDAHVRDLWERMLGYEFQSDRSAGATDASVNGYRSDAESRACHQLYRLALLLRGIGIDPCDVTPGEPLTFSPPPCARCGERPAVAASYCQQCGNTL